MTKPTQSLSYKDAGVDIDAGNALIDKIKGAAKRTRRPEVMAGLGGFGALFELPTGYQQPVLVSGTDGVGTKLRLALDSGKHSTVGIDLVAMCVNDLIVCGAEPLFFLDYYATGKLDVDIAASVVNGIADGCELSGCSLIGGETAEMPSIYIEGKTDLVGCIIGLKDERFFQNTQISSGDVLIGIPSVSPHTNGYSLINKIFDENGLPNQELVKTLLKPHKSYLNEVKQIIHHFGFHTIKGMCHITGGGFHGNMKRVLPENMTVDLDDIELPNWCTYLMEN